MQHDERSSAARAKHYSERLSELHDGPNMLPVGRAFQVLQSAVRELSLRELDTFVSLRETHTTKESLEPDSQFPTDEILHLRSNGTLRTHDDYVTFAHPSLEDIFDRESDVQTNPNKSEFREDGQRFVAEQCMRYLLLEKDNVGDGDDSKSSKAGSPARSHARSDPGSRSSASSVKSSVDGIELALGLFAILPFRNQDFEFSLGLDSRASFSSVSSDSANLAWFKSQAKKSVLLDYAARHWPEHYRLTQHFPGETLHELARELLSAENKEAWLPYFTGIDRSNAECPQNAHIVPLACYFGFHAIINRLPSTAITPEGLYWAARNGHVGCIQVLLRKASDDFDWRDHFARALFVAIERGHEEASICLIKFKPIAVNDPGPSGQSPLAAAVSAGRPNVVREILSMKHADISSGRSTSTSALFCPLASGSAECLDMLLKDERTNMGQRDKQGRNAVLYAAWKSAPEILEILLDVNPEYAFQKDKDGYTAIEWTLDPPEKPANAEVLLRRFPKEFEGEAGLALFNYAMEWGAVKIAQLLVLRHVFDINVTLTEGKNKGDTALSRALRCAMKNRELGPLKAVLGVPGVDLTLGNDATKLRAFVEDCAEQDRPELKWLLLKSQRD
jgi:ankyrin repeat protein